MDMKPETRSNRTSESESSDKGERPQSRDGQKYPPVRSLPDSVLSTLSNTLGTQWSFIDVFWIFNKLYSNILKPCMP